MNAARRHGGLRSFLATLRARGPLLLELFVTANLGFLVLDIYLAHSVNAFADLAEWIPFVYAGAGALVLAVNLAVRRDAFHSGGGRTLGMVVGALGILVGVTGLVLHLESRFFQELTLRSLVYSAPFVAPLAFAGLGFLLLLNRMVEHGSPEWAGWIVFFAWAGFVGNFGLSLADHAQNGFFYPTEWIPVVVSALAVGYLFVPLAVPVEAGFIRAGYALLAVEGLTGLVGFGFHLRPVLAVAEPGLAERIIYGAPLFAPLLFTNLALLGALGLWALSTRQREKSSGPRTA